MQRAGIYVPITKLTAADLHVKASALVLLSSAPLQDPARAHRSINWAILHSYTSYAFYCRLSVYLITYRSEDFIIVPKVSNDVFTVLAARPS